MKKYKKTSSLLMSMITLFSIILCSVLVMASGGIGDILTDNTSVIYGASSTDSGAASVMQAYLETFGPMSLNTTIISGELAPVKTSSQPLYLNDDMRETKATFTDSELPTVLASGEVDDYDYDLKISVPSSNIVYSTTTDDFDKPIINAEFDNDAEYEFKVIFPTPVDFNDLEGEAISLFGKDYVFAENDLSKDKLILLDSSNSILINEGETEITETHQLFIEWIGDDETILTIDGKTTSKLSEGDSYKISDNDYLVVKNILYNSKSNYVSKVEVNIGSGKLVLENDQEVELMDESIDGTNVVITPSGEDKIREIVITSIPERFDDEIEYLKIGDDFIDPVFGTVKFSLDTVQPELKSDERDFIEIKTSGDDSASIEFTNKAGGEYNFEFIEDNEVTFLESNIMRNDYFITGKDEYTQIWKVEKIGDDEIEIKDMAEGSETIELDTIGTIEFTLADGSVATITRNGSDAIEVNMIENYLYTEDGAKIEFDFGFTTEKVCNNYSENTVDLSSCGWVEEQNIFTKCGWVEGPPGFLNCTEEIIPGHVSCEYYDTEVINPNDCENVSISTSITVSQIIITEETDYNDGKFTDNSGETLGSEIIISIENLESNNSDDIELKLSGGITGDDDNTYLLTNYGTFAKEFDKEKVEVYYSGKATEYGFNIGEIESKITKVTEGNDIITKLTDGSASASTDKDLIVIGGSCINTVAANLLGGSYCGSEFTTATGVGAGQALIQVFTNPYNANGKAILVAGYEKADTERAVNYLKINNIDTTIGSKIII